MLKAAGFSILEKPLQGQDGLAKVESLAVFQQEG
jgi:hypothetical protein